MAYKVFISATHKDMDLARDLARRLKEVGVKVFPVERSATPEVITVNRSLREADEVIVILTDSSVNSQRVIFEMGAASGMHKRVTPVVVGVEDEELPPMVKQIGYVRYANLHDYIADLERRAKAPELQSA
jgi:hypothetical protein